MPYSVQPQQTGKSLCCDANKLSMQTAFASSLEPASYITQNSHWPTNYLFPSHRPSSKLIGLTCYTPHAVTVHHFFTVSLWAKTLPISENLFHHLFQRIVCFYLSD